MNKIALAAFLPAATLALVLGVSLPASAATPSPNSSCSGQLSQGATPHGASEAEPGLLGSFVSEAAKSGPGAVGQQSRVFAKQHGDLGACIPF